MRKIILIVLMCLVCSVAQAKIIGKVIAKQKTSKGFIKITTRFIDDKDTVSTADDEQVGSLDHRLWSPLRFRGKTKAEIKTLITNDLKEKARGNYIYQYMKKRGIRPLETLRKENIDTTFNNLPLAVTVERLTVKEKLDTNKDGLCDEEWTIKTDGTESRVSITPVACN